MYRHEQITVKHDNTGLCGIYPSGWLFRIDDNSHAVLRVAMIDGMRRWYPTIDGIRFVTDDSKRVECAQIPYGCDIDIAKQVLDSIHYPYTNGEYRSAK